MNDTSLPEDTVARLRRVPVAVLATQLSRRGCANSVVGGVRAIGSQQRMVGEAVTLRFVPSRIDAVAAEAISAPTYPQRQAIEACGPGQVLMVDGRGSDSAAIGGEVLLTRLAVRGAAGYVVDGCVRDEAALRELDLPVFAQGTAPFPHPVDHMAADWDVPVGVGGALVMPRDVVVGDADGVLVIPRSLVDEILEPAEELRDLEDFVLERIRRGAALDGTFPPDAATLREYDEWRTAREPRPTSAV